jgi:hypothetical protein
MRCAKLLCNFQHKRNRHLLELRTLIVTHRARLSLALLASILIVVGLGNAQTVTGESPQTVSSQAAQPVSQAAETASGQRETTPSKAQDETAKNSTEGTMMVKLGAGDLIEISVYNVPELASKARVSNSGDVYLPLIDYVHVEGLTQEEAQALIEKRLSDGGFVRNPHVTIFVDEASSQGAAEPGCTSRLFADGRNSARCIPFPYGLELCRGRDV